MGELPTTRQKEIPPRGEKPYHHRNKQYTVMASQKDKDYHKMRKPEYYGLDRKFKKPRTREEAEAQKILDKMRSKYGFKERVENKRRRCNSRKSNQSVKQMISQMERAQRKHELINIVKNL